MIIFTQFLQFLVLLLFTDVYADYAQSGGMLVPYEPPEWCGKQPPPEAVDCRLHTQKEAEFECIAGTCKIWGPEFECITCVCKPGYSGRVCCHDDRYISRAERIKRENSISC